MEKFTVIGVNRSIGVFNGSDYDNLILHCVVEKDVKGLLGKAAEQIKITWSEVDDVLGLGLSVSEFNNLKIENFENLIGCEVQPFYNKWSHCIKVDVYEKEDKES